MTGPIAMMRACGVRTTRAAAAAGIVFSVLFASSTVLTKWAIPPGSEDVGDWLTQEAS